MPDYALTEEQEAIARRIDCSQRLCVGKAGRPCRNPTSARPRGAHNRRLSAALAMLEAGTLPDPPNHADSSLTADSEPNRRVPERLGWRDEGSRSWRRRQAALAGSDFGPFDD